MPICRWIGYLNYDYEKREISHSLKISTDIPHTNDQYIIETSSWMIAI